MFSLVTFSLMALMVVLPTSPLVLIHSDLEYGLKVVGRSLAIGSASSFDESE